MTTKDPYGLAYAVRPGYGTPEPVKPVFCHDTQEHMEVCMNCCVEGGCNMKSKKCGLRRDNLRKAELDSKVRSLMNAGWRNNEAICEELGISKSVLFAAKRRLRKREEG